MRNNIFLDLLRYNGSFCYENILGCPLIALFICTWIVLVADPSLKELSKSCNVAKLILNTICMLQFLILQTYSEC